MTAENIPTPISVPQPALAAAPSRATSRAWRRSVLRTTHAYTNTTSAAAVRPTTRVSQSLSFTALMETPPTAYAASTARNCQTNLTETPSPGRGRCAANCTRRYGSGGPGSSPHGGHLAVARTGDKPPGPRRPAG